MSTKLENLRRREWVTWHDGEDGHWVEGPASVSDLVEALLEQGAETRHSHFDRFHMGQSVAVKDDLQGRYLVFRIPEEEK